ncbi:MAG: MarR family transcriptional regulator [Candidatus Omnitrophica bacterium]|nr:MarR family transcriptional regulator [Candidatus Omnitrophota bacterium]
MNSRVLSLALASMVPGVIRGMHLDFFSARRVTQTQFMMPMAVRSQKKRSMSDLAGDMKVSMPTVTGIIERLVRLGYVRRVQDAGDRRRISVEATAQGDQFIRDFQKAAAHRWSPVLETLDEAECRTLHKILLKLQAH